ncbi:hypothetical protein ACN38_g8205 [Penicillium nordicum]|uniref:Uncharacterized protein n=1 Tax=Penicillium nordicum TaxID=229535 RepID=A0A0M8NWR5_9EURO|nr:hypothetical protein ACN38_g8205 [Penicillium nordicum]
MLSHENNVKRRTQNARISKLCVTSSLILLDLISDCLFSNQGFICTSVKLQMLFKLVIGRTQIHLPRKKPSKTFRPLVH